MNIISCNVRDLGRPSKLFLVKDFLNLYFTEVCCLQESKLDDVSPSTWREIKGSRSDQFLFLPASGSAGSIIVGWNSLILTGKLERVGAFSLIVEFCNKRDNFIWRCTSVYGPNTRALKNSIWDKLRGIGGDGGVPWIIYGDFNAIFNPNDKCSGVPNLEDIRCSNAFLSDMGLIEPSSTGRKFTWTNGQVDPIWVKLDHFLVNCAWAIQFPKLLQNNLLRLGSDHVPIKLEVGSFISNPRPFH